jgi:2-C-methyl-D-erythritol 2,4-cyclodiphosphate synthase
MKIGHGYDAHRFAEKTPLILGGVHILYEQGLEAHSDGDVLVHALCDALLGAAGLGDIGRHFPDNDNDYKNIDSRILLRKIVDLLELDNYFVSNVDMTVIAQKPKLANYLDDMEDNLAEDLNILSDRVNIKATTTEKMGFTGRCEGIACHAVTILMENIDE